MFSFVKFGTGGKLLEVEESVGVNIVAKASLCQKKGGFGPAILMSAPLGCESSYLWDVS